MLYRNRCDAAVSFFFYRFLVPSIVVHTFCSFPENKRCRMSVSIDAKSQKTFLRTRDVGVRGVQNAVISANVLRTQESNTNITVFRISFNILNRSSSTVCTPAIGFFAGAQRTPLGATSKPPLGPTRLSGTHTGFFASAYEHDSCTSNVDRNRS